MTLPEARALAIVVVILVALSARRSAMYNDPPALWHDVVEKLPSNGRAYDALGSELLAEKPPRYAEADVYFTEAIARDSTLLRSWLRRAGIAAVQGRYDDAEHLLLHVLAVAPKDSEAIAKLGGVYLVAGKPDSAVEYIRKMLMYSTDANAYTNLGNAYMQLGRLDSAAVAFQYALQRAPNDPTAYQHLGMALVEADNGSVALPYLERANQMMPSNAVTLGLLSIAYAQAADTARSIASADAAARTTVDPSLLVLAGRGVQTVGRRDLALRYFSMAVQADTTNPEALTRLAIVEAEIGRKADAAALVSRAMRAAPGYPPAVQLSRALGLGATR